jgi:hypothetical protein
VTELGASILWTAMPVDLVIDGLEPPAPAAMEMMVEGRLLQVLPGTQAGTGTVQRLLSTDPQDYLDPRWQPGTVINLS